MKLYKKKSAESYRTDRSSAAGRRYFLFTYYQVDEVQVMEAAITQRSRSKKWF